MPPARRSPPADAVGTFVVNTADNKENTYYFAPFDPGEDQNNQQKREQSLVIEYDGIPRRETSRVRPSWGVRAPRFARSWTPAAARTRTSRSTKSMSLYFRDGVFDKSGAPRDRYSGDLASADGSTGTLFFRFGPDTTNFLRVLHLEPSGSGHRLRLARGLHRPARSHGNEARSAGAEGHGGRR